MGQREPQGRTQAERLREYFQQLPPKTLVMLATQFEKALAQGEDTAIAELALGALRPLIRSGDPADRGLEPPRLDELQRLAFAVLEPFLIDGDAARPGQIKRSSLDPIWTWLTNTGAPEAFDRFRKAFAEARVAGPATSSEPIVRRFQRDVVEAIATTTDPQGSGDKQRNLARVGAPAVADDLVAIQTVLSHREALDVLHARLPRIISTFGDSQVNSVRGHIAQLPSLQAAPVLPFVMSLVMQRMTAPWQITRLAVSVAGSDEETRVAATPFGVAVSMALYDLGTVVDDLRQQIRRGHFDQSAHHLKSLHDGLRDFRTELDLRSDSVWGRQLTAIRADVSNALTSEIESVPGRVRRLLRQRSEKDIQAGARLDVSEADETVALVNFVAACRNYAGELAINEVSLRSFSDLQHYVEAATEALVESLRAADARVRAFRQRQVELAVRFCEVIFGHDYAALMSKAAEVALSDERKSSRAG